MSSIVTASSSSAVCLFLDNCKIVVDARTYGFFVSGADVLKRARERLERFGRSAEAVMVSGREECGLHFICLGEVSLPSGMEKEGLVAITLEEFYRAAANEPWVEALRANAIRIPYLYLSANEYIYRFRAERERNRGVYQADDTSMAL